MHNGVIGAIIRKSLNLIERPVFLDTAEWLADLDADGRNCCGFRLITVYTPPLLGQRISFYVYRVFFRTSSPLFLVGDGTLRWTRI